MTPRSDDAGGERTTAEAFRVPLDILIAPARAFESVAADPRWLPSYVTILALALLGGLMQIPATKHVVSVTKFPAGTSAPTPDQLVAQILLNEAIYPLIGILLTATALTAFAALSDAGKAIGVKYATYVSLASACYVIWALGEILSDVVIRLHDPASFGSPMALQTAFPVTLAGLASPDNERQMNFLSHFGLFDVWQNIVLAFGFARLSGTKVITGLILAFSLDFAISIFFT